LKKNQNVNLFDYGYLNSDVTAFVMPRAVVR